VVGHADRTGSDITNSRLSEQRARQVIALLLASGMRPDSLTAIGEMYGGGKESAGPQGAGSRLLRNVAFQLSSDQASGGEDH
jgi:hypothetical protein